MFKLIATDLDGTLLDHEHNIHKDNIDPIKKAIEKGVKIVLCSGRSYTSIHQFEKQLGLIDELNYGIGFNGAMVYNCKTRLPIKETRIKNELVIEILKETKIFDLFTLVYVGKTLYVSTINDEAKLHSSIEGMELKQIEDLSSITEDASKILIESSEPSKLLELEKHILKVRNNKYNSFFTQSNYYEFIDLTTNKGNSLKALAAHLNIDMKDVIAIGDNYNDIQMLEEAGVAVAVANAVDEVKKHADYITKSTNNEGAIREVIEKYIL